MKVITINKNSGLTEQIAQLLEEAFPHAYAGQGMAEAENFLQEDRIAVGAVENGKLIGFVGAIMQYSTTGWELHPLMVKESFRFGGIGTALVNAIEKECAARGAVTIYLGTDDEFDKTSLSNTDLYENTYNKMENAQNKSKHPFEFYQKAGYKIVGVIPDANGIGKPDIIMAKRIG